MTEQNSESHVAAAASMPPTQRRFPRSLRRVLLPLAIVVGGMGIAVALIKTGPQAKRKSPVRRAQVVAVRAVRFSDQPTAVEAMGTIKAAREIALHARVSGQIIEVHDAFVPGSNFLVGQVLVRIDPTDYELAVQQRMSDVARTRSAYQLEAGQQEVARREVELAGDGIPDETRDLVLRRPQLESAKAALAAAEASLERAELDRERTQVAVPFNALLRTRHVDIGSQVNTSTPLVTLVGTDAYWVEVLLPVDQLKWLHIPRSVTGGGSKARVYNKATWGPERYRSGRVIRLEGAVESEGRMARLIVSIDDPLALRPENVDAPVMLLGTYVRVELEGKRLNAVAAIERSVLRDGNHVWIMNADDRLEIRPVEILFQGRETVLVKSGISDGEQLVTTDLSAPVQGMPLQLEKAKPEKGSDL